MPLTIVRVLYKFVSLPIVKPKLKDLPSEKGLIERIANENFDHHNRGLVQGLPINPILAIIGIKNGIDDLRIELKLSNQFRVLSYADDLSIYCSMKDFKKLGKEN